MNSQPEPKPPAPTTDDYKRDFDLLHDALVVALPGEPATVASWWRRVQLAADGGDHIRMKLLKAEAENRLDHASRKTGEAVLKLLFKILGLIEPN